MPKISQLPTETAPTTTDSVALLDAETTTTKKTTLAKVLELFFNSSNFPAASVTTNKLSTELQKGWEDAYGSTAFPVPNTITNNGNRSYDLVFNSVDLTGALSLGMRLKMTRTVTAPTQCSDLEASSSQYFNKTSPAGTTFTDDFVCGAWVKLESYPSTVMNIVSRYNGTSGWAFDVDVSGRVRLYGYNASGANYSGVQSTQSIPLGKWVYVTAQLDMSAFVASTTQSYIMFNGLDVPASVARSGTNPTALVQAGNLEVGSKNSTEYWDGKLAQVFYSSAKITQANVRTLMGQGLTASLISTHSIVSAYSLSNAITDLNTTTANNLTAQGSASATDTDSPFAGGNVSEFTDGTTEMGIITKTAFSTNTTITVQVPEGYAIPTSGGVSAVSYSVYSSPYGFPCQKGKWSVQIIQIAQVNQSSPVQNTVYNLANFQLNTPIGAWILRAEVQTQVDSGGTGNISMQAIGLSTSSSTITIPSTTKNVVGREDFTSSSFTVSTDVNLTAATIYYLNSYTNQSSMSRISMASDSGNTVLTAEFGLL